MDFIKEPLTIGMDPFSEERITIHLKILSKKRMIREVFKEFQKTMLNYAEKYLDSQHTEVELGAGVFPLKNSRPSILATDILPAPHLDRVLDAQNLDLKTNSVSVLYGQNCFHHFPQPELFFAEATRVLVPNGGIILIEPHYGFLSNLIYKRLFSVEGYSRENQDWYHLKGNLPNQALSYLCFIRDNKKFREQFPELEVVKIEPANNWIRYLLSGGLNFKQLFPDFTIPILKGIEFVLKPLDTWLALHCYFVIKKKGK